MSLTTHGSHEHEIKREVFNDTSRNLRWFVFYFCEIYFF